MFLLFHLLLSLLNIIEQCGHLSGSLAASMFHNKEYPTKQPYIKSINCKQHTHEYTSCL